MSHVSSLLPFSLETCTGMQLVSLSSLSLRLILLSPTAALMPLSSFLLPQTAMMNSWYFRVAVLHDASTSTLKFEHPTLAGTAAGGWMERLKAEGQDILRPRFGKQQKTDGEVQEVKKVEEVKMTKDGVDRKISLSELEEHNKVHEPWFVVNGEGQSSNLPHGVAIPCCRRCFSLSLGIIHLVYDGTGFLKDHPGGVSLSLLHCRIIQPLASI